MAEPDRTLTDDIRAVLHHAPDFIARLDTDLRYRYVNSQAGRLSGIPPEAWIGRSTLELGFESGEVSAWADAIREALETGEPRSLEASLEIEGREHWFETRVVPERDPDGVVQGLVLVARDTTKRVLAERHRVVLEELLDRLGVGIIRLTRDGVVLECNRAAGRILAPDRPRGLVGTNVRDFLVAGRTWAGILGDLDGDGPTPVETPLRRADGGRVVLSGLGRAARSDQGVLIVEGLFLDVTEQTRLREEVVEISTRERIRIGQDLHDDLGQHLTGLAFLAGELRRDLAESADPARAEQAAELERLANEGVRKTRHLARGVQPPALRHRGLRGALEGLARDAEDLFDVRVELEAAPGIDDVSTVEAEHLFRIAQEAVTNAARHGSARNVRIVWATGPWRRSLTVRDDGSGFRDGPEGEGLGLRIMRYRAHLLGGELTVEGDAGPGARVCVALPAEDLVPAPPSGPPASGRPGEDG